MGAAGRHVTPCPCLGFEGGGGRGMWFSEQGLERDHVKTLIITRVKWHLGPPNPAYCDNKQRLVSSRPTLSNRSMTSGLSNLMFTPGLSRHVPLICNVHTCEHMPKPRGVLGMRAELMTRMHPCHQAGKDFPLPGKPRGKTGLICLTQIPEKCQGEML